MTVGQRIQQIRALRALSQEEFGALLGVTRQTVSKWELDQTLPELSKVVLISKLFSVTTDSILIDGITSFDISHKVFLCGIYQSELYEIVETEVFSLVYYCNSDKTVLGSKLYMGFANKKRLCGICERNELKKETYYAYKSEVGEIYTNDVGGVALLIGVPYDPSVKKTMRKSESFFVDHSGVSLPGVNDSGIAKCLSAWRMGDIYRSNAEECFLSLCTDQREYVFSVQRENCNVYCGASYIYTFDFGLFFAGQYFRIRHYKDNTEPFCGFGCNFSFVPQYRKVPTELYTTDKAIKKESRQIWSVVKRYTDDEIVLEGCGDDEYFYRKNDKRTERFVEK